MNILRKNFWGLALVASLSFSLSQAQETRTLGEFTGIKVGDSFHVKISQGESNSMKIDISEDISSQIKTEIKDGILNIFTEKEVKSEKEIVIYLGVKNIGSINITGAAEIETENQLICDKIDIESNGVGDASLDLKANSIKVKILGAGDIILKGTSKNFNIDVVGAGNLKASELEADRVIANVSGVGDAKVNVKESLTADVSGAGSVIYKGNPVDRNVTISGVGSVRESKLGTGEETASDTTKFKFGNKKYMIIGDDDEDDENENGEYSYRNTKDSLEEYNSEFKHWAGFEFGVNGFLDYQNKLDMPAGATFLELDYSKSVQIGLNLMEKDFHLYKNYVNLVIGFGFDFNHYSFKNNITLNGDTTYLSASTDNIDYKKNKLNVSYIKIPLLLEFNTSKNPDKNFHIAVGGEFAYRIHSVAKQRYDIGDIHFKSKQKDDFNLEPFRYSATARVGYNNVTVFANYGLNRLFQKNKGPQIYPFTLGVCFAFS